MSYWGYEQEFDGYNRIRGKVVNQPFVPTLNTTACLYDQWADLPVMIKKRTSHMVQVCAFWFHIVLCPHESNDTTKWAVRMGFVDPNLSNDMSLDRLYKIEMLETILLALEKGCLSDNLMRRMADLSDNLNMGRQACLENALRWLELAGARCIQMWALQLEPNLYSILQYLFSEYVHYVQAMGLNHKTVMDDLLRKFQPCVIDVSERMKAKGNELFQKKNYEGALKLYTKAIKNHPTNHLLYGNRALCFIRCEKYLKAVADGKRAMLIQPDWAKGHYRFCEALFLLGERHRAVQANQKGQALCQNDPEGIKDLLQQYVKLQTEMKDSRGVKTDAVDGTQVDGRPSKMASGKARSASAKRAESASRGDTALSQQGKPAPTLANATAGVGKKQESKVKDFQAHHGKGEGGAHVANGAKGSNHTKSEMPAKKKNKAECSKEQSIPLGSGLGSIRAELKCAVRDAHAALEDQRCGNAVQAFSQALRILESTTAKELGISELDKNLLIYGHATALVEIGQPEELALAERKFQKMKSVAERKFQCLVYYGTGKVYLKENRFPKALHQFHDALQMVQRQVTPGKLTWPTTTVTVEETRPGILQERLETSIEMCRFPPKPDAICHHHSCLGHSKIEIYFTDPDFKGFIRLVCCQNCSVEFHIGCWKKLKSGSFPDKNDKDFLQITCFTPDCGGKIFHIVIFGPTGIIKCEFESSILKPKKTAKIKVRQTCTSLKKLKSKEERKLRRRQHERAAALAKQEMRQPTPPESIGGDAVEPQDSASSNAWALYGDRVLHQIQQHKELFNVERPSISDLLKALQPWMDLDRWKRAGEGGGGQFHPGRVTPKTLADVVELLLVRKNRVWARVFVEALDGCVDVSPRLRGWAHELDSAGLTAAMTFIERHAAQLEELDLAPLLHFAPLQEALLQRFGSTLLFLEGGDLTVTDYLKQAPARETRLFIWTLEEHRQDYCSCFAMLDDYFEIMDGLCILTKRPESESVLSSPDKNKRGHRKKRQKESKSIVLSGSSGGHLRDDHVDYLFSEEDSLHLLNHREPFSIPSHLQNEVAEFEDIYNSTHRSNHHKSSFDINPDPIKDNLYNYFAQVLKEHGPLTAYDPLLTDQLDNFPPVFRQKIQDAGGLRPFLLDSDHFVAADDHIELKERASPLPTVPEDFSDVETPVDGDPHRPFLNPAAKDFLPGPQGEAVAFAPPLVPLGEPVFPLYHPGGAFIALPCPHSFITLPQPPFIPHPLGMGGLVVPIAVGTSVAAGPVYGVVETFLAPPQRSVELFGDDAANDLSSDSQLKEDVDVAGTDTGVHEQELIQLASGMMGTSTAVQVFSEPKDNVAVNTEAYEPYERNPGDMTKKEKNNAEFEKQIHQMKDEYEALALKRKEDMLTLQKDLETIHQNIEVTKKEQSIFQQKLEEEVRKDQQEKKENQETLKALKNHIKELAEANESLSKGVLEKKEDYEASLNNFLDLSNQSAAEKMSLEDEIKRCREQCVKAARRSQTAELTVLEYCRRRALRRLNKCVSDGQTIISYMTEVAARFPTPALHVSLEAWRVCVQDAGEKLRAAEAQYDEQKALIETGAKLLSLPQVTVASPPMPPPMPVIYPAPTHLPLPPPFLLPQPPGPFPPLGHYTHFGAQAPVRAYSYQGAPSPPSPAVAAAPPPPSKPFQANGGPQVKRATQPPSKGAGAGATASGPVSQPGPRAAPPQQTVFDKIIDRLLSIFPHYSRPVLNKFIEDVRTENGGCLSSLSYEDIINSVTQLILDHQDTTRGRLQSTLPSRTPSPRSDSPASGTPPPGHVWKNVGAQKRSKSKALNMEDPCIICHEDMTEDVCVLECRHSFHRLCIKSWLKEQSTCPTCREHALLPEDFPMLPDRIRKSHSSAAL